MLDIYITKLERAGMELAEPYKGNTGIHHNIKCLLCDNIFTATIKSKIQNYKNSSIRGCPRCTMDFRFKEEKEAIRNKIEALGFQILTPFRGKCEIVTAINTLCGCGRSWQTKPIYILSERSYCKPCNDEAKAARMKECNDTKHDLSVGAKDGFKAYKAAAMVASNRAFRKMGITGRSRKLHLDHIVPISYCFKYDIPVEICADPSNLRLLDSVHNVKKHTRLPAIIPSIFKPYIKSNSVIEDFVERVTASIPHANFEVGHVVNGVDTTLYDPEHKITLFLITLEEFKQQNIGGRAALKKLKLAMENEDNKALLFFEDEWNERSNVILSKLKYIYGISTKIYARTCSINSVPVREKSDFLDANHLQGNDRSTISYGLYHAESLVAIMTFSSPKIFMKGKRYESDNVQYELSRFCVKQGMSITGAASKLLSHFSKTHLYDEIFSFADKRVSDGGVYENIGFTKDHDVDLDYSYIVDNKRRYRWDFRKDRIREKYPEYYDVNKTEYQMMLSMGIDRIWDCGKIRYSIHKGHISTI